MKGDEPHDYEEKVGANHVWLYNMYATRKNTPDISEPQAIQWDQKRSINSIFHLFSFIEKNLFGANWNLNKQFKGKTSELVNPCVQKKERNQVLHPSAHDA